MTNPTTMVELIPRKVLLGNPLKASPQISPDGTRMAYLAPVNDVLNVWVGKIGSEDYRPVTKDEDRGIRFYTWARDNKHILYIQDIGGNENWRLYATNLETQETRDLTPFENVQSQVIDIDKHFPDELLIAMNKDNPKVHDVYHLDLISGELTLVTKNPGNVAGWISDSNLKVRGALAMTPDGGRAMLLREDEGADWQTLITWNPDDAQNSFPIGLTKDGQAIYLVDARNANSGRLVRMDINSGAISVIAEDPQYDAGRVITDPDTYQVQAVAFNKERVEWTVIDESIRLDFDTMREITRGDFSITSRDDADENWVVAFSRDNGPVAYYVYNRKTRLAPTRAVNDASASVLNSSSDVSTFSNDCSRSGTPPCGSREATRRLSPEERTSYAQTARKENVTFLFDNQPNLNQYMLAIMEPVSFTSRDGLTIHGYLTLPPRQGKKSLPLVLNVHGGPQARDGWGYNPEAQWLANRGYACLQVNYRGSTGYGKEFLNAGNKEWGGKMHNDLVDAVTWAIDQGIADPKKVAIYGGSYGGYAALVGTTFTPDLFCCAVDIVGPSNLITLIKSFPPYWSTFLASFYRRVGNPDSEEEFLKSRSPLFKVDQIKIPILIAQGANDPRVKQAESEQIVEAMKNKGIDYEYMLFPDEGHGFAKPENRLKFYAAAEKFLAKHLGGRFEEDS